MLWDELLILTRKPNSLHRARYSTGGVNDAGASLQQLLAVVLRGGDGLAKAGAGAAVTLPVGRLQPALVRNTGMRAAAMRDERRRLELRAGAELPHVCRACLGRHAMQMKSAFSRSV